MDPKRKKILAVGLGLGVIGIGVAVFWPRKAKAKPKPQTSSPAIQPEHGAFSYTVTSRDADGLTAIAQRLVGSQDLAMWIYDLNRDQIGDNINLIRVGQVFQIPTRESVAALPGWARDAFRQRFEALKEEYREVCSRDSWERGRGTRNCTRNAIIEVSAAVSAPTVEPSSGGAGEYERDHTGATVPVTSKFRYTAVEGDGGRINGFAVRSVGLQPARGLMGRRIVDPSVLAEVEDLLY